MDFDWKATLATVAPTIASALGTPVAGIAVKMALDALGIDGGDEDALAKAVASNDPDVFAKIKAADQDFEIKLKELDVEIKRINAEDRNSARALAIAKGVIPQAIISIIFIGAYVYVLNLVLTGTSIDPGMHDLLMMLVGIMSAGVTQVLNFWLGSSSGSKAKTDAMARLAQ